MSRKRSASLITLFGTSKINTKFACEVKNFDPGVYLDREEARKLDRFSQLAIASSEEAVTDAGLREANPDPDRVGVIWGPGTVGLRTFLDEVTGFAKGDGTPRFNPFFIPKMIADIASGHIPMRYGYRGPNYTTVSACASS